MPSPPVEQIEVKKSLADLGVKEFHRLGSVLQIIFTDGDKVLTVDIDKKAQKTLKNLDEAATSIDLDAGLALKLRQIIARDYREYLKLPESNAEKKESAEESGIHEYTVFKYSIGIPLAEQIKLNGKYVFLQIIDGKPVSNYCLDLSATQNMILYPRGRTPILDFEYDDEEHINKIIEVAKTKTIDELITGLNPFGRNLL